jgi:hypothetical protein
MNMKQTAKPKPRAAALRAPVKRNSQGTKTGRLSLKELAEEFRRHRDTDETKFTPFQRRMMLGGA